MRTFVLLALFTSLSSGCASVPHQTQTTVPELPAAVLAGIDELIRDARNAEAFQLVSRHLQRPETGIDAQALEERRERIKEGFRSALVTAAEAGDYDRAMLLSANLRHVGGEPPPGLDRSGLERTRVERLSEDGRSVLAVESFLMLPDEQRAQLSPATLERLAKAAADLLNPRAAARLVELYAAAGLEQPAGLAETAARTVTPAEIIEASATIWVNRGIRIERGVGLPDRVIGSGFFIDPSGYLLTNYHVIESEVDPAYEGYSRLYIRLSERGELRIPAQVVGFDRIFDIALLKVEMTPSRTVPLITTPELKPGNRVFAVGSPVGLQRSLSSGIVSAVNRRFLQMGDAIQIDVPVNPGSSGGPLIDDAGRLAGVVFAGIPQFQGINFAIPFDWVSGILPALFKGGEVRHAWLGAAVQERDGGFPLVYIDPTGPAHRAGLRVGDRLVSLDDQSFSTLTEMQAYLLTLEPDQLVGVRWRRGERDFEASLALQERPFSPLEKRIESAPRYEIFPPLFGFTANLLGRGLFSEDYSIAEVFPGTAADEAGLSKNDPFTLQSWRYDRRNRAVYMQISIRRRRAGFLEGSLQMGAYIEINNFI